MNKKINQWIAFIDDEDKELSEMAEKNNKVLKIDLYTIKCDKNFNHN